MSTTSINLLRATALVSAITCALAIAPAIAQTPEGGQDASQSTRSSQADAKPPQTLGQITVTGSHLLQSAIQTTQPVVTITQQEIRSSGYQTVGQLLQNLPSVGPSINMTYNQTQNGIASINLHDLGSNRVLVLVNGQRWITTINGITDLTSVPLGVVERIDVMLDGASAVYGSEAIAGVVNIITKSNFNGVEVSAMSGAFDANGDGGGWDGLKHKYDITFGTTGAHSGILFAAGYSKQNPVYAMDRTISQQPTYGRGVQNGFPPEGGRFVVLNLLGVGTTPAGCVPGAVVCDVAGPNPSDPSGFHPYTTADNFNTNADQFLVTPSKRSYIFTQGHYDFTPDIQGHFTAAYRRRISSRQLFPFPMLLGVQGSNVQNGMQIGVAKDAPGNPFGVDLVPYFPGTPGFGQWCSLYGSSTCESQFDVAEVLISAPSGLGVFHINDDTKTTYFNGGLNGNIGDSWVWNANYIYSKQSTVETALGRNMAQFQNALSENCSTTPGCAPIDIFGYNTISQSAANYVNYQSLSTNSVTMQDLNASVTGPLFESWYAGEWDVAMGVEAEHQRAANTPDPLSVLGDAAAGKKSPTSGGVDTNAVFAELSIPLLRDVPFVKSASLDFAERFSRFRWDGIGNEFDPSTGTVGFVQAGSRATAATPRVTLKWVVTPSVMIRATWARGFRTPDMADLFSGISAANFVPLVDPCVTAPSSLPAGCGGVPHSPSSTGLVQFVTGGSVALKPEQSTTSTVGLVLNPASLPDLAISADVFRTKVNGLIQQPDLQGVINGCFVAGNASDCDHIVLSGTGSNTQITQIFALQDNVGSLRVAGADLAARYRLHTQDLGDFALSLAANFVGSLTSCLPGTGCSDIAGTGGSPLAGPDGDAYPKQRYNATANWTRGAWSASYSLNIIGPMWEDCALSVANGEGLTPAQTAAGQFNNGFCSNVEQSSADGSVLRGRNHIGTTAYSNFQVQRDFKRWNTTIAFGIQNLFNRNPPIAMAGGTYNFYNSVDDIPGRFFYANVRVRLGGADHE